MLTIDGSGTAVLPPPEPPPPEPPPPEPPPEPELYVTVAEDVVEFVPIEFVTESAGTVKVTGPSPVGRTVTVYVPLPLSVIVWIVPPVALTCVVSSVPPFVVVIV